VGSNQDVDEREIEMIYGKRIRLHNVEKAGFALEGTMRQAVYKHGGYADVHFMSVLRSKWDAHREDQ
jgi:L-amino acid N-acyltransferase YncA